jgi:hypothetical protein
MRERAGWSTEYAREKFDVEVDDNDLGRLFGEWQIDPAYQSKVTILMRHQALSSLANWLAATELARFLESRKAAERDAAAAEAETAQQTHYEVMWGIRTGIGLSGLHG